MTRKRIAHLADLHIDANPEVSLKCLEFAYAAALAADVDAVVIAGDIWHRGIYADDRSPLVRTLSMTRELSAQVPVVIIKGNSHDMPGSLDVFKELRDDRHEIIVATTATLTYAGGIAFALLPYPDKAHLMRWATSSDQDQADRTAEDAVRAICGGFAAEFARPHDVPGWVNAPRVLVFHGNVHGCTVESGQQLLGGDVLVPVDALESSTADYVAMGHIHRRQQMGTKCHYSGSLHHVTHGETGPRVMLLVDVWRGGYEIVDEIVLPSRAKVTVDATVVGISGETGSRFYDIAYPETARYDVQGADVKVRLRMTPEQAAIVDRDSVARMFTDFGAESVDVEPITARGERTVRAATITTTHSLRGKVEAWGGATGTEIPTGTLDKADAVEGGVI